MQEKGKPVLIGNMYRPPDSRVEYDDRLEEFIENVLQEGKEIILLVILIKIFYRVQPTMNGKISCFLWVLAR